MYAYLVVAKKTLASSKGLSKMDMVKKPECFFFIC